MVTGVWGNSNYASTVKHGPELFMQNRPMMTVAQDWSASDRCPFTRALLTTYATIVSAALFITGRGPTSPRQRTFTLSSYAHISPNPLCNPTPSAHFNKVRWRVADSKTRHRYPPPSGVRPSDAHQFSTIRRSLCHIVDRLLLRQQRRSSSPSPTPPNTPASTPRTPITLATARLRRTFHQLSLVSSVGQYQREIRTGLVLSRNLDQPRPALHAAAPRS